MDRKQIEAKYDILSAKASGAPDEPWTECVALDDVLEIAREAEKCGSEKDRDIERAFIMALSRVADHLGMTDGDDPESVAEECIKRINAGLVKAEQRGIDRAVEVEIATSPNAEDKFYLGHHVGVKDKTEAIRNLEVPNG